MAAWPWVRDLLTTAAENGLGSARRPWRLMEAHSEATRRSVVPSEELVVQFVSPLRLRQRGDLVTPDRLSARLIVMAAARRLTQLGDLYGSGPVVADFRALTAALDANARLKNQRLRWQDVTRRSARQGGETMKTGGIIGTAQLALGELAEPLGPLLAVAEKVGIGRNTTLGCGQVCFLPSAGPVGQIEAGAEEITSC